MKRWTKAELAQHYPTISIGENVRIEAESLEISEQVVIGDDVQISAQTLKLGHGCVIEERCRLKAMSGPAEQIDLGDLTFIGHDSKILLPHFIAGDYVSIHNHALVNGHAHCVVGHNSWVGQHCVLNANEPLNIGNHVGIGAYCSLYTHCFFGDVMAGCQINTAAPVTLEDDVWLMGSYTTVAPGVTIGKQAVILNGSVITRDVEPGKTVGGNPPHDLSEKVPGFKPRSDEEKLELMREHIEAFCAQYPDSNHEPIEHGCRLHDGDKRYDIICTEAQVDDAETPADYTLQFVCAPIKPNAAENITLFSLTERAYTKRLHPIEIAMVKFLRNPCAKFVPISRPIIEPPQR